MTEHKRKPFPQFDDSAFEGNTDAERGGSLIRAIIAWDAAASAERPHVVLRFDPEVGEYRASGPYATAYLANEAAVELDAELNDPTNNDGPRIVFRVIPIEEAS